MSGLRACHCRFFAQSMSQVAMILLLNLGPIAVMAGEIPQSMRLSLDAASAPPEFHINAGSSGNGGSRFFTGNGSLPDLYFSVDRLSTGLAGSVVHSLAPAGADIFVLPTGSPVELYQSAFDLGLTPGLFGDELDALDCYLGPGMDSLNAPYDYNVIWRGSSMIGTPVSQFSGWFGPLGPADILIGTSDEIFSRGHDIGLQLGDAIDALIMLDVTPDTDDPLGFRFESDGILQPGLDLAIFSLDPYSPTVTTGGGINPAWTPGTIFLTRFDGSFEVLLAPHELGLSNWDNIDALSFVPEPTTAGAFMLAALLTVALRRRSNLGSRRSLGALLVMSIWVSLGVPQADAEPMRRYCGEAPAAVSSRGTLELDWTHDGQVTFFVRASDPWPGINDPDDPDAIVLPPQIAENATVVPGSEWHPQKIVFSHTVAVAGFTLSFNGNVNVGAEGQGAAVLDVQIVGQGNAVRYLMGDVSEFGVSASFSPPDTEAAICANQPLTYEVKVEPNPKWPPAGQWRIEGLPPDLFEVTPDSGQWEALNPDQMLLVPFQVKLLQPSDEPYTMSLVVTGDLGPTCHPIRPSYEPPGLTFRVPSMVCRLDGEFVDFNGRVIYDRDVYFEEGDTATLRVTLSNPCADILTGTYTISGGEGAYDTPRTFSFGSSRICV